MSALVLLSLTVVAVVVVAWAAIRFVVAPRQLRRYHDDLAHATCVSGPPGPDHDPHLPVVAEYEALGYRVADHVRVELGGRPSAITLLVAPDGSVADVAVRSDGVASSITSLLGDGTCIVETVDRQNVPPARGRLVQVFPGATVAALVARHRDALAWLAERGVATAVHPDGPAGVIETSTRLLAGVPAPSPSEATALVEGRVLTHAGPLERQPDVDERLRDAGLVAV